MKKILLFCAAWLSFSAFSQTQIVLHTSLGDIHAELNAQQAPKTVANFLNYVQKGFYNGTIFHRVINGFMIQGGGFDAQMNQKSTVHPIENESQNGLNNLRGSIAMARTSAPHSATAQFFINLVDNNNLDYPSFDGWGYCVFGKVIAGMDVVDKIATTPTGNVGAHQNVPTSPVIINAIQISQKPKN